MQKKTEGPGFRGLQGGAASENRTLDLLITSQSLEAPVRNPRYFYWPYALADTG
jgi:hypothetical protein